MLLGTLEASMLVKMLTGNRAMRVGKGVIRTGTGSNTDHMGKSH